MFRNIALLTHFLRQRFFFLIFSVNVTNFFFFAEDEEAEIFKLFNRTFVAPSSNSVSLALPSVYSYTENFELFISERVVATIDRTLRSVPSRAAKKKQKTEKCVSRCAGKIIPRVINHFEMVSYVQRVFPTVISKTIMVNFQQVFVPPMSLIFFWFHLTYKNIRVVTDVHSST